MAKLPNHPITQSPNSERGLYYDRLSAWTRLAGLVGYGGGRGSLLVHRALVDPRAGGRATPARLNDIVAERVKAGTLPDAPRLLDAGCGFGGVMLDLVGRIGGTAIGLTLSAVQADAARKAAAHAGLSARVSVLVQDYDDPPAGPFDLVVAIESLAHSGDPQQSLEALTSRLAPGGQMVIVDDMPEPGAEVTDDLARFKAGWQCPVLWNQRRYHVEDLSRHYRPREMAAIERLEWWNGVARVLVPVEAFRAMLASYSGGLSLERLYRRGLMRYMLIAVTKAP
jgi:SAM-dependent methyltransferase